VPSIRANPESIVFAQFFRGTDAGPFQNYYMLLRSGTRSAIVCIAARGRNSDYLFLQ